MSPLAYQALQGGTPADTHLVRNGAMPSAAVLARSEFLLPLTSTAAAQFGAMIAESA
jgi:hypothetical protein